jgi:hypothetical protein
VVCGECGLIIFFLNSGVLIVVPKFIREFNVVMEVAISLLLPLTWSIREGTGLERALDLRNVRPKEEVVRFLDLANEVRRVMR